MEEDGVRSCRLADKSTWRRRDDRLSGPHVVTAMWRDPHVFTVVWRDPASSQPCRRCSLTPTSSLSSCKHHPGSQTSTHQDQSESIQPFSDRDGKATDVSVEAEVLSQVGCGWEIRNSEEDLDSDPDDGRSLFDHKAVVDLSTSKTSTPDHPSVNRQSPDVRGHVTSGADLGEIRDRAGERCSSSLSDRLRLAQRRSPVHY